MLLVSCTQLTHRPRSLAPSEVYVQPVSISIIPSPISSTSARSHCLSHSQPGDSSAGICTAKHDWIGCLWAVGWPDLVGMAASRHSHVTQSRRWRCQGWPQTRAAMQRPCQVATRHPSTICVIMKLAMERACERRVHASRRNAEPECGVLDVSTDYF